MQAGALHLERRSSSPCAAGPALFLCPVCLRPLLGEEGLLPHPCDHLLLVAEAEGLTYWRDELARRAFAGARGRRGPGVAGLPVEGLPGAVLFELLDDGAARTVAIDFGRSP